MVEPGTRGDPVEAASPSGPSDDDWIRACRRAVAAHRAIFASHQGIGERSQYEGVGEGGDSTLVIDRLCEDAIFAELEDLHRAGYEFTATAEERGTVAFGSPDAELAVIIDPIDGSLNARRTIPLHSVSIAIAEGDSMADVRLGYVYEFGAGEEFIARRGSGAALDGVPISVPAGDGLEIVALEASKPERVLKVAEALQGRAYRMRCPGSIAVALSYVAAGRFDGMITTRSCRSVDAAAAQLIAREAGAAVEFAGKELSEAPLDLSARYDVAAARTPTDLGVLLEAQKAVHG